MTKFAGQLHKKYLSELAKNKTLENYIFKLLKRIYGVKHIDNVFVIFVSSLPSFTSLSVYRVAQTEAC